MNIKSSFKNEEIFEKVNHCKKNKHVYNKVEFILDEINSIVETELQKQII